LSAEGTAAPSGLAARVEAPPIEPAAEEGDPRRWLVLITVLVGQFLIISAAGAVNIALPSIREDLDASDAGMQWILVLYQLGFAATLVTGGRLGDLFGRKRVFLVGLAGFVAASALAAAAPGIGVLVFSRLLQGVFGGVAAPQVLAMIQVAFPPAERPKAFAAFGTVNGSAFMIGLLLTGGLLGLDPFGLDWRVLFLLNVVVGAVAMAASAVVLPRTLRGPRRRLDLAGVALASAGSLLLLYPLVQGRNAGWPPLFFALLALSVPVLASFLALERRRTDRDADPLVDLRLFRARSFRGGLATMVAFSFGTIPTFFIITLTVQEGLGFSPLKTAVTTAPTPLGVVATAMLSSRLVPRFGRRMMAVSALCGMSACVVLAGTLAWGPRPLEPWHLIPALLLQGASTGTGMTALVNLTLADVRPEDAGSASGVFQTVQQSMAAVGIAGVGIVFFGVIGGATGLDPHVDGATAALALTFATNLGVLGLHLLLPSPHRGARRRTS